MNNLRNFVSIITKTLIGVENGLSKIKPPGFIPFNEIKNILFLRTDRIGDAVNTVVLCEIIKKNFPSKRLYILASPYNAFVFQRLLEIGIIEKIYKLKLTRKTSKYYHPLILPLLSPLEIVLHFFFSTNASINEVLNRLKGEQVDLLVDLVGMRRSLIIKRKANIRYSIGMCPGFGWLHTYSEPATWIYPERKLIVDRYLSVLSRAIQVKFEKKVSLALLPIREPIKLVKEKYDLLFYVGGGSLRKLPLSKLIDLVKLLSKKGLKILMIDDSSHKTISKIPQLKAIDFVSHQITIEEIAWIAQEKCQLILIFDGGMAHYLSTFNKALVIFGPGDHEIWAPWDKNGYAIKKVYPNDIVVKQSQERKHRIFFKKVRCCPCFDIGCLEKTCLDFNQNELNYIAENIMEMMNEDQWQ